MGSDVFYAIGSSQQSKIMKKKIYYFILCLLLVSSALNTSAQELSSQWVELRVAKLPGEEMVIKLNI